MIEAAVLTISDSAHAGARADLSGPMVRERLEQLGWRVSVEVLPDGTGFLWTTCSIVSSGLDPLNGGRPTRHSYRMAPSE